MLPIFLIALVVVAVIAVSWLLPILRIIPKSNADFECHFGERRAAPLMRAVDARSAEVPDAITSASRQSSV